tara:strand:+ start:42266 stop:43426 length:1161 start_codon:yes stop_codon:yes gene_type:complete
MRIIICGDSHIGAVFGLGKIKKSGGNTRVDDYERSFNYIVDYAIESEADVFVQTGDIFESRSPSAEHMEVVNRALKKLSKNNISSIIIMGNHDYIKCGKSYSSAISTLSAKDYPNVRMVLEPQIIDISNNSDSVQLLLVPYRDKRMYDGDSTKERSKEFDGHISDIIKSSSKKTPIVAIGHNFFYEGSYNDYGGSEVLANPVAFDGCDLVVMGHQHNFRVVRKSGPPSIYIGSMEKTNFGDQSIDKFFIDYNTSTKKTIIKKNPVRDLCDAKISAIECNESEIDSFVINELKKLDLKDKIARVRIAIKDSMITSLNKKRIESEAYSMGAFYLSKIVIDAISHRIVRDISVLNNKDDYSIFKAFVESQEFSDDISKKILESAGDIIK